MPVETPVEMPVEIPGEVLVESPAHRYLLIVCKDVSG